MSVRLWRTLFNQLSLSSSRGQQNIMPKRCHQKCWNRFSRMELVKINFHWQIEFSSVCYVFRGSWRQWKLNLIMTIFDWITVDCCCFADGIWTNKTFTSHPLPAETIIISRLFISQLHPDCLAIQAFSDKLISHTKGSGGAWWRKKWLPWTF